MRENGIGEHRRGERGGDRKEKSMITFGANELLDH
jgi:hypothetical protein